MKRTIKFNNLPTIIGSLSVAGPKESSGSIVKYIHTSKISHEFLTTKILK